MSARHDHSSGPLAAAERLSAAWTEDFVISDLPVDERPETVEAGYEIQDLLAQALGEVIVGYKLGLSSPNAMRASGLGRPVAGFMPKSRVHGSGAVLPIGRTDQLLIEVEVAFEIAKDIRPEQTIDRVENILGRAWLAVEVVRSHFVDRRKVALPSFIADGAGFHRLVLGSDLAPQSASQIEMQDISLLRDGICIASKAADGDRAEPLNGLRMFLAMACERNRHIPAGTIVSTGNLIGPYETGAGGRFEALAGNARVAFTLRQGRQSSDEQGGALSLNYPASYCF